MIVFKLLFIVVVYVGVAVVLAWLLARRRQTPKAKAIAATLTLLVFALIPTWDILPGRLYFNHLCATEGGLKIYKTVEGVEGFYLDSADTKLIEHLLIPNSKLQLFGRAQWLDGIHEQDAVIATPKDAYRFVETGREGNYYKYRLGPDRKIIKEAVSRRVSGYGRYSNTTELNSFFLNGGYKVQYEIVNLTTKEKVATLTSFSAFNGWLQKRFSPLLGKSLRCPEPPVIHEAIYFSALRTLDSKN